MSGAVTSPSLRVTVNGARLANIERAHVSLPAVRRGGRWTANVWLDPTNQAEIGALAASDAGDVRVVVSVAADGHSFADLMAGDADALDYDAVSGELTIEGRDLSALFHDTRTTKSYMNRTASEIASELAAQAGLSADVTPTKTLVGRYYADDHTHLAGSDFTRSVNQWDLLVSLGSREGIDPYVSGTTLYFRKPASPRPSLPIWVQAQAGIMASNALSVRVHKSFTEARAVSVTVKSWHGKKKESVFGNIVFAPSPFGKHKAPVVVANTGHSGSQAVGAAPNTRTTHYLFTAPGLTKQQADDAARRLATEISQHERRVETSVPGWAALTPEHVISLTGVGAGFDIDYPVDDVSVSFSLRGGLRTQCSGRTAPPRDVTDAQTGARLVSVT